MEVGRGVWLSHIYLLWCGTIEGGGEDGETLATPPDILDATACTMDEVIAPSEGGL